MKKENKTSKPMFDVILNVYTRLLITGYEPARARRIMNLYLEP